MSEDDLLLRKGDKLQFDNTDNTDNRETPDSEA